MSEYTEQAEGFLKAHSLKFRAVYLDTRSNPFWNERPSMPRAHYRCTVWGKGRGRVSFQFWQSIKGSEIGEIPDAYSLLACVIKQDPESFETFCSEYGYDVDSRKAMQAFRAVIKEWHKVCRFFTEAEIEELQEIQ